MTLNEVRQKFLDFFREKGHAIIPSASLIPDDKTVLFVTAGMQPLVPYLMGEKKHSQGTRLADSQKCLRTDDILEVGDNRHLTFFEMLGNWSLGDYFKKEAIEWSFELLTSKKWFGIDPKKLYVTVFEDKGMDIPRDDESIGHWVRAFKSAGMEASVANGRIATYPKKKNWWELAGAGPCGPDTEIFYDTGKEHDTAFGKQCHVNCECGRFVEIWNNVFMEYEKKPDGKGGYAYTPLAQKNVDTGMGLERIAMVLQGVATVFDTDVFKTSFPGVPLESSVLRSFSQLTPEPVFESDSVVLTTRSGRIIADHLRASVFLLAAGIKPSNKDAGYILRRLIRRLGVHMKKLSISQKQLNNFVSNLIHYYGNYYSELNRHQSIIIAELKSEFDSFNVVLEKGLKEFEGRWEISGKEAFYLYQSQGFPFEILQDLAKEKGNIINEQEFQEEYKKHQEISRVGSEKKFGGHGLMLQTGELKAADEEELKKVTRLHTATHLLQAALRKVLGDHVHQKGSDITAERLRFDFSHPQKMTDEEKKKTEDIVNEQIQKELPMVCREMPIDEAEKVGALMFQKEKYGKTVKVYSAGDFSKELCGGPHVSNTKEVGTFKILKEEASSAGVRRIRATVDPVRSS
ncbi:alanine--tRNA ligase [Candidatus Azambacteria bacterium]|nr:alanine--tRNA ligase [Candidatus Azambacteria bacterium]